MQDSTGTIVSFNFTRNSNKHKSWFGGLLTIVTLIGAIYFGSTQFFKMINRDEPAHASSV